MFACGLGRWSTCVRTAGADRAGKETTYCSVLRGRLGDYFRPFSERLRGIASRERQKGGVPSSLWQLVQVTIQKRNEFTPALWHLLLIESLQIKRLEVTKGGAAQKRLVRDNVFLFRKPILFGRPDVSLFGFGAALPLRCRWGLCGWTPFRGCPLLICAGTDGRQSLHSIHERPRVLGQDAHERLPIASAILREQPRYVC